MTTRTKIYVALAALTVAMVAGAAAWGHYRIRHLERAVDNAKQAAAASDKRATEKEAEAGHYLKKIEYLERQLGDITTIARKQDEKLEILTNNSRRVRGDLERARRTRVVPADTDTLCAKLADLGHPCGE